MTGLGARRLATTAEIQAVGARLARVVSWSVSHVGQRVPVPSLWRLLSGRVLPERDLLVVKRRLYRCGSGRRGL